MLEGNNWYEKKSAQQDKGDWECRAMGQGVGFSPELLPTQALFFCFPHLHAGPPRTLSPGSTSICFLSSLTLMSQPHMIFETSHWWSQCHNYHSLLQSDEAHPLLPALSPFWGLPVYLVIPVLAHWHMLPQGWLAYASGNPSVDKLCAGIGDTEMN